jgi:uncharacterized protein
MNDSQCLGICMIDPDSGACLGCGRLPEEISGVPVRPAAAAENFRKSTAGLPENVTAALDAND